MQIQKKRPVIASFIKWEVYPYKFQVVISFWKSHNFIKGKIENTNFQKIQILGQIWKNIGNVEAILKFFKKI